MEFIFECLLLIALTIVSIKMGINLILEDLKKNIKINSEDYDHYNSWEYLMKELKYKIIHYFDEA